MTRPFLSALGVSTLAAVAVLAQPATPGDGDAPGVDNHPPAGHPTVFKPGDDWPKAKAEDVSTLDAILGAYYASTSGTRGAARDWTRFKSLFHPQARLIPARPTGDGGAGAFFLSPSDFAEQNDKYFRKSGFVDREIARRTESFGNVTHVWSTYESRRGAEDGSPYARGVASVQLLKDGGRWWIVSVFWDYEREGMKLPDKYLSTPKE